MPATDPLPTAVLCGGQGTRLGAATAANLPKALIPIGGRPILWHILRLYAEQGWRHFILCLGYRGEDIRRQLRPEPEWRVEYVDTGETTPTGGRLAAIADRIRTPDFFATYGDGLADLDFATLLAFHRGHQRRGTLTAVQPRLPFGLLQLGDDQAVTGFHEKPYSPDWINGGFFVFRREFLDTLRAEHALEGAPLERLAQQDQLRAFQHRGFWACLDTYKDRLELDALCTPGPPPWQRAQGRGAGQGASGESAAR